MKIKVTSYEESDDDCYRQTYVTQVDGKEFCLAACALGSYWTHLEIQKRARKLFGDDVEIEYRDCSIATQK